MAKIIQRTSQLEALDVIQAEIKQVSTINTLLHQEGDYIITTSASTGASARKQNTVGVVVDKKGCDKIVAILTAQRDRLVKDVRLKADKFEIALEDDDDSILNGVVPEAKWRTKKPAEDEQAEQVKQTEQNDQEEQTEVADFDQNPAVKTEQSEYPEYFQRNLFEDPQQ